MITFFERMMNMKTTQFTFFKNTPLTDFQNTIHFQDNNWRDIHFLQSNHYEKVEDVKQNYNFIRQKLTVDVNIPYNKFMGVNYGTFLSDFENTRYYVYIIQYEYVNDETTRVYMMIDPVMTFTQGNVLENLSNLKITRQHLPINEYNEYLPYLKNNDDILKTFTKSYIETKTKAFKNFNVVIQCTADLTTDFGTVDNPKIETSEGTTFDKITSPVNLYATTVADFNRLMKLLAPYPWITQNIKSVLMIPSDFIDVGTLIKVHLHAGNFEQLYRFPSGGKNRTYTEVHELTHLMSDLYDLFDLDKREDRHLLRNEYTTSEIYSWDGQRLLIDNGQLKETTGIQITSMNVVGYINQFSFFLRNYRTQNGTGLMDGSFLNDAIIFNQFDEIPILIDNVNLALSKSANQRALTESKLVSGRIKTVFDKDSSLQDRFYNAASLLTNLSPSNLLGKFNDEYEFYRQQKAEQADLALNSPTITAQTNGNGFQISNDIFGLTLKFSAPNQKEWEKVKKYYKLFGYQIDEENKRLSKVDSMTIANYLQFSGNWTLKGVDNALIEQMKPQFENGVRFWHDNGTANPMNQNILNNKMR